MPASDAYKGMLNSFTLVLKEYGYSRKGNTYYVGHHGNWGLIDFQRSQKSNASCVIFTINLGSSLRDLIEYFTPDKADERPSIEACHWRQRIGVLLPHRQDKWWSVTEKTSLEELTQEVESCLIGKAVPEVERHISTEQLQGLWLSAQSPGLTNIQRLINLSVLLKKSGSDGPLESVLQELRDISQGKPAAFMVKQHMINLQGASP